MDELDNLIDKLAKNNKGDSTDWKLLIEIIKQLKQRVPNQIQYVPIPYMMPPIPNYPSPQQAPYYPNPQPIFNTIPYTYQITCAKQG